ncbi:MAG: extracellular solute-binding protein [Chloroflexota bacterium]
MPWYPHRKDVRPSRRRVLAALAAAGVGISLGGCGPTSPRPGGPRGGPSPTPPPTGEGPTGPAASVSPSAPATAIPSAVPPTATPTPVPRTLALWTTRPDSPWLKAISAAADLLTAIHPNLRVEVSGGHSDFGKIVESFGTLQAPDVIEPGDLVPFAARSLVQPLDHLLTSDTVDASNYLPAMWENGSWRGKAYGIPALDHGPELGLVWNTSLTATASAPQTWSDLYVFGRQLTRRDAGGTIQTLGFDPLDGVGGILDTVRDVTGQDWFDSASNHVTIDNPVFRSFVDGIVGYYRAVGIEQVLSFRKTYPPMTGSPRSAVNVGREVAILNGYWSVAEVDQLARDRSWAFNFAWPPTLTGGTRVQRVGGRILAIPTIATAVDDAWALVSVLCGDSANRTLYEQVGTCAMTRSFLKTGAWQGRPGMQFYVDSLGQATRLTSRSNNVVAGFAQAKWTEAIGEVLGGTQSTTDALKAAQVDIQTEVSRAR